MTVKPTVVCRYATYPGSVVLAEWANHLPFTSQQFRLRTVNKE